MNTICANDHGPHSAPRPTVASVDIHAYRVFLNLPETLHRAMIERARAGGQGPSELYQTALSGFARNFACGVRLPVSVDVVGDAEIYVQLPADQRRWVRRLASRLSLSESDIVAAAADWLLAGGVAPAPTAAHDRSHKPSTHDPPG